MSTDDYTAGLVDAEIRTMQAREHEDERRRIRARKSRHYMANALPSRIEQLSPEMLWERTSSVMPRR